MTADPGSLDPKGLGAIFDAHCDAKFKTRDIQATMATMGDSPHITNVPTMTGGFGYDAVRHFYENYFVGHVPDDWSVELISRTVGESQLVDEVLISFTHDCEIPAILPGVKPSGRKVVIPFVVVVGFYWDQASLLAQIGLLDRAGLPVSGAEQAARLLDPSLPSNALIPKLSNIKMQLKTDELNDVLAHVLIVKASMESATSAWLSVARQFDDAKKTLSQIAFERFVNEVGVTKSVADKLLIIGRRKILHEASVIVSIATAEGWTVLYELAKLDEKKVQETIDHLKSDPSLSLTRELIHNVVSNRPLDEKRIVLASIEIDSSKLTTMTTVQSDLIASKLADISKILADATTLVFYRKRSKGVTKIQKAAQANSCVSSTHSALAA